MKSPRDQRPGFGQLARVAPSAIRLVIAAANARFSGPRSDWARRTRRSMGNATRRQGVTAAGNKCCSHHPINKLHAAARR